MPVSDQISERQNCCLKMNIAFLLSETWHKLSVTGLDGKLSSCDPVAWSTALDAAVFGC